MGRKKVVGIYEIGYEQAELVLREGTGGDFTFVPKKGRLSRIQIGADYDKWSQIVAVLLHEAFEYVSDRLSCRYYPRNDIGYDSSCWFFIMNHNQMQDCLAKVAEFTTAALPHLEKVWKAWKKEKSNAHH